MTKLKKMIGRSYYALLERLPLGMRKKLTILPAIARNDWKIVRLLHPLSAHFVNLGEEEVNGQFKGLDEESLAAVKKHIALSQYYQRFGHITLTPPRHYLAWSGMYSRAEIAAAEAQEVAMAAVRDRLHLPPGSSDASCLIHHHGLTTLPAELKSYVAGKIFVDAGAYLGDSTLVFLSYEPHRIYAFEPSRDNQHLFQQTMRLNNVSADRVVLVGQGLSNNTGALRYSERSSQTELVSTGREIVTTTTIDQYFVKPDRPVGLIKADVEGLGLELILGAVQTIKRDRPVLSIAIYHNTHELFGVYKLLNSLGLEYRFKILSLCLPWQNNDLILMAYPSPP